MQKNWEGFCEVFGGTNDVLYSFLGMFPVSCRVVVPFALDSLLCSHSGVIRIVLFHFRAPIFGHVYPHGPRTLPSTDQWLKKHTTTIDSRLPRLIEIVWQISIRIWTSLIVCLVQIVTCTQTFFMSEPKVLIIRI